ncbi:MAG TPA: hypothetical protein EYN66_20775, partial [Myxococcales bacterium]|nr:hypothetical protein [Myxococcales bacterium]
MLANNSGDILHVEAGDYAEEENLIFNTAGTTKQSIVGETHPDGSPAVTVHRNLPNDLSWQLYDAGLGIYRSKDPIPVPGSNNLISELYHAWGHFRVAPDQPWQKLVPYPCLAALASERDYAVKGYTKLDLDKDQFSVSPCASLYQPDATSKDCTENCPNPLCEEYGSNCPYIGPGLFYDRGGSEYLYIRLDQTEQMAGEGTVLPTSDPAAYMAESGLRVSVGGMLVYFGPVNNLTIKNVRFVNAFISLATNAKFITLENVAVDGIAAQHAIEIGKFNTGHTFDGLFLTEYLPDWLGYADSKLIYSRSLMTQAFRFGGVDATDIVLKNSTISRFHDGIEMASSFSHGFEVAGNTFVDIGDDAFQLGSRNYDVSIHHNRFERVFTSVSRHGNGEPKVPGTKYIYGNFIDTSHKVLRGRKTCDADGTQCYFHDKKTADNPTAKIKLIPDGKNSGWAFGLHVPGQMGVSGDPRHFYNNTIIYRGYTGISFSGQYAVKGVDDPCPEESICTSKLAWYLPWGAPAIVANNLFIHHPNQVTPTTNYFTAISSVWFQDVGPAMISDGNAWFTSGENPNLFYVDGQTCDLEGMVTDFCGIPWFNDAGWISEQNSVVLSVNPLDADGQPLAEHCASLNAGNPVNLLYLDNPAPDTSYTLT